MKDDLKIITRLGEGDQIRTLADNAHTTLCEAGLVPPTVADLALSLTICHLNGCPLDLARMLEAPTLDTIHDVTGIHAHLDHSTGELGDCFLPRFAQPQTNTNPSPCTDSIPCKVREHAESPHWTPGRLLLDDGLVWFRREWGGSYTITHAGRGFKDTRGAFNYLAKRGLIAHL